jgi:uncharacterized protein (DUF697 family)
MFNIGDIVGYNPEHFTNKDFLKMRGIITHVNPLSGGIISVKWNTGNTKLNSLHASNYMCYELKKINNLPKDLFGKAIIC